jgi:hypothetical protein
MHIVNTVRIKPSKAQLEDIPCYPNPYPNICPRSANWADSNRRESTGDIRKIRLAFVMSARLNNYQFGDSFGPAEN